MQIAERIVKRAVYLNGIGRANNLPFEFSKAERDEFDRWLVETRHPLAYEAGTQESRMLRYASENGGDDHE